MPFLARCWGHFPTLWDVIIEAVVPSDADGPFGASGCPGLELRGLEPLTSSMPWKRPPSFLSAWLQLALITRVRCLLGPICAEMKTSRLLSSVTTHGLPDDPATCKCKALRATRSQLSIAIPAQMPSSQQFGFSVRRARETGAGDADHPARELRGMPPCRR
jgi:hypothetical protein